MMNKAVAVLTQSEMDLVKKMDSKQRAEFYKKRKVTLWQNANYNLLKKKENGTDILPDPKAVNYGKK